MTPKLPIKFTTIYPIKIYISWVGNKFGHSGWRFATITTTTYPHILRFPPTNKKANIRSRMCGEDEGFFVFHWLVPFNVCMKYGTFLAFFPCLLSYSATLFRFMCWGFEICGKNVGFFIEWVFETLQSSYFLFI